MIEILKTRFEANINRHNQLRWHDIEAKLILADQKISILQEMEKTGGEPDVIDYDQGAAEYIFADCSPESPIGRRNLCYDRVAWDIRKESKPEGNAVDMAADIGIELMTENWYRKLQMLGSFDTKTSSWINTPEDIRKLGGALFADRRYDKVFVYHNSAPTYYRSRGFRGILRV